MDKILELETELNRLKQIKEIKESISSLQEKIKPTTDLIEELEAVLIELETVGWRAVFCGDEYNYGNYQNFIYKTDGLNSKELAEKCVEKSKHGGFVERILFGQEKLNGVVN